jgi:hypothetical protein
VIKILEQNVYRFVVFIVPVSRINRDCLPNNYFKPEPTLMLWEEISEIYSALLFLLRVDVVNVAYLSIPSLKKETAYTSEILATLPTLTR